MKIAVEGCAHGELDNIYDTIKYLEEKEKIKIDLLICCGDFQASRNEEDLRCMAVPPKYYNICSFYKYYNGEKIAPVLTIFIGGNHEASNYLQELPYGGWVAPKIYYLGYAGVINIGGLRIGGLSGIYKGKDYLKGHFEHPPYNDNSKRSVYHIRNLEVFRLKQLSEPIDIFLSHDWPGGIWNYGNKEQLLRFKPYFEDDINNDQLGSKPTEELLHTLKPKYWFAAHLHCKFAAVVPHECGNTTRFLALDKCLPQRRFLQIVDIPHSTNLETEISYDLEWLTILRLTNHLLCVKNVTTYMPGPSGNERWSFTPTEEEKTTTLQQFGDNLVVPDNFIKTAVGYVVEKGYKSGIGQPQAVGNPQTDSFCKKLQIDDPVGIILNLDLSSTVDNVADISTDNNQTFIDSDVSINAGTPSKFLLNLPKPIKEVENDQQEESEENFKKNQLISKSEEEQSVKTSDKIEMTEVSGNEPVVAKKFKRRNASMYQNEETGS